MPRYAHAVLGGTFDRLHVGHAALLGAAFAAGRQVSIGLTTDAFVGRSGKPAAERLQPYATRRRALVRWLRRHFPRRRYRIVPLEDTFGRSVGPGIGVLVVSAETAAGGRAVNAERRRRGRRPVPIVTVPLVLADDLRPVSSRRIRAGEIDRRGRRVGPISAGIATADPSDRAAAARAVRRAFPRARVHAVPVGPGRADSARALAARAARGLELGLGVVRRPGGGWSVAERSRAVALDPRVIPGRKPAALVRGLASYLAPRRAQAL